MARKASRLLIAVVGLAVVAGAGIGAWRLLHEGEQTDDLILYGNVDIRQIELAFNGTQRIRKMIAAEGDTVAKGQLLGLLDTSRLEPMVQRAQAEVLAQQQVVAKLEAGTRKEDIRKAEAEVAAAEASSQQAQVLYDRTVAARERGAATDQELTNAKAGLDGAQAALRAAREVLALAILGPRKEDIAAARATLRAQQAGLALLEQELADARLLAPCDAVVQVRVSEPGDMASPQTAAYVLARTDPVWIRAYVDEPDLGKVRPGMKARVTTDSFPGKTYEGWVGFISPTAEFTPKNVETPQLRTELVYQVRIYVHNPQNELRLGMPATVTIPLNQPAAPSATRPADCDGQIDE